MIKKIDGYLLCNDDIIFANGESNSITFLVLKWVFLVWILIILNLMMLILMKVVLSLLCISGLKLSIINLSNSKRLKNA